MSRRENLFSMYRRTGYQNAEFSFSLCPALVEKYRQAENTAGCDYPSHYDFTLRDIPQGKIFYPSKNDVIAYYGGKLKDGTVTDIWGVAHEKGSEAAMHMTRMLHPLENVSDASEVENYPFPDFSHLAEDGAILQAVRSIRESDHVSIASGFQCTIWETAWYLRGMEALMIDMMENNDLAHVLFDRITEISVCRAEKYAGCGVDILFLGDDIGMQRSIMMSVGLWKEWIFPRLKKVTHTAKNIKPDILIQYHSCGYIEPFIPYLIEAGVDILNPVQPECMDFSEIHRKYGDKISFNGTLGTQTLMPFGSPEEVYSKTQENLRIAGRAGGLLCCPTHLLESEVPYENVLAYMQACKEFRP